MNLLTIGDYYRERYGRGVEVFCSVAIILSYLGWVAAQITALGLVFSVLTDGAMSETAGMIVGTLAVLVYVVIGGFLAVAWTDFIQMIVLVVGLSIIAVFAGRPGRRRRQGDRAGDVARTCSTFLPAAQLHRHRLLHRRGHHHDAGQHPAAGRVPARDVGQGRRHRAQRRRDRRRQLHPVRLRADVHRRQRGGGDGRAARWTWPRTTTSACCRPSC